jgi:hypothetical protein
MATHDTLIKYDFIKKEINLKIKKKGKKLYNLFDTLLV